MAKTIEQEMVEIITTALKPLRDTIAKVSASQKRTMRLSHAHSEDYWRKLLANNPYNKQ